jgi:hypothetical protein
VEKENNKGISSPILDTLAITARKPEKTLKEKNWWELTPEEKLQKKFNRAYQRFMLGRGFGGQYRLITLTTPETFKGDIHKAWRKWIMRMRRRGLAREYYAVKEWNEKYTCIHIHAVLRLDYIGYQVARQQWQEVTGAVWIHVEKVYSVKGMANYLGKYLNKGYKDMPGKRGYWYAYEWIYRKWHAFSKTMFKLGECISACEHELIHGLTDLKQRLDYMNWRLIGATLHAVRVGLPVTELVQIE